MHRGSPGSCSNTPGLYRGRTDRSPQVRDPACGRTLQFSAAPRAGVKMGRPPEAHRSPRQGPRARMRACRDSRPGRGLADGFAHNGYDRLAPTGQPETKIKNGGNI